MRNFSIALVLGLTLFIATQGLADDSSAALGAGGLVFTKQDGIRMTSEDLYISPKQVRIRFEFTNVTAKDIDTIVAFPLPDVDMSRFSVSELGTTTKDPINFVGFKTTIDGKPVPVQTEQRAYYKNHDVTEIIQSVGLPLNIINGDSYKKLDSLSGDKKKILEKAGLAEANGNEMHPYWLLRTTFYWTQHFPTGKTIEITHSYQPVTGQSLFGNENIRDKEDQKNFCIDVATSSALSKALSDHKVKFKQRSDVDENYLSAYTTDYILKTGNNWKGPIEKFHLTLDKLKASNTLSVCWDGDLKKTSATTFESTRTNFSPARDIHMLVVE